MSQKAIREYNGKLMISNWLAKNIQEDGVCATYKLENRFVQVSPSECNFDKLEIENPWVLKQKLVAKPDQLIKRRGKGGLILLNASWDQVKTWIGERMNKPVTVEGITGTLTHFIVEPFCPHENKDEYYLAIRSLRTGDEVLFYHQGGVDVGDVDSKASKYTVPIGASLTADTISQHLFNNPEFLQSSSEKLRDLLSGFIVQMFKFYTSLHFAYLEINPLVVVGDNVIPLDLAAKIDQTAEYECGNLWGNMEYPAPFGRALFPEEEYIQELDSKTGASLKLTILNPNGRIWTMVAGGGASVAYADTISDLGAGREMANYGEYSGDPNEALTYEYAKTVLSLLTREKDPRGKVLLIGGGIANFTNVAETFKGIIRALKEFKTKLVDGKVKIYVRRGGPNYQQGLKMMSELGFIIGVPIEVYGPETHLTSIVSLALGMTPPELDNNKSSNGTSADSSLHKSISSTSLENYTANYLGLNNSNGSNGSTNGKGNGEVNLRSSRSQDIIFESDVPLKREWYTLFDKNSQAIIYGMQPRAVQGMLDFDHSCGRKKPSVTAMIYPFAGNHYQKFYFGPTEILVPIYQSFSEALKKFTSVDTIVNFSSCRSVFPTTMEALEFSHQIRTIAIIAEGVPERYTRLLISKARETNVTLIGPATVGGIKPGCFRIGNTGGMLDNIISSKLYRPGSVAFVSKSGGMSNELNNIISRSSNGTYEGIAIGGDRYPGTTFIDHFKRFQADPEAKMLVLLGEVGGTDEYEICEALKSGQITKPLVAWCMGTCAKLFPYEVQFGHAGALANGKLETADAKNEALKAAGAIVPNTFQELGQAINSVYRKLVSEGIIVEVPEIEPPTIPMDYSWAQKLGLVRKPSSFVSSISDERGDELIYAGMPISNVFQEEIGVGGVISLLWFRRRLPPYACKFIEMVLMVTADHGPAVSGAHNTIVTARAGKDLISSLVSGLLTIGPRFGGAIDGAAEAFSWAYDTRMSPREFVDHMRKKSKLIEGIGHKVKTVQNPDMRVKILKDYIFQHFVAHDILDYALEVEKITTQKKNNLILNVDGCIGAAFVDLLRSCGAFTREESDELIKGGVLNGLFVLGRSIGLIGHFLDQGRLKQGLYRHPWDDISYINDHY